MVAGLCLAPWAWRNERALGSPIFLRSNFGLELYISNNDLTSPRESANSTGGLYPALHPSQNLQQAEEVRDRGEVAYNRDRLRKALFWIPHASTSIPGADRATILLHLVSRFAQSRTRRSAVVHDPGEPFGMLALWRAQPVSALLLTSCLAAYSFLYYFIQVSVRYRLPVDWILLLTASSFATALVSRLVTEYAAVMPESGAEAPAAAWASRRALPDSPQS